MNQQYSLKEAEGLRIYQVALALEASGKSEDAVEAYREAVRVFPDLPEAHFNLGVNLALLGQADEAVRALRRAVWLKPDFMNDLVETFDIDHERKETIINPSWEPSPALAPRVRALSKAKRGGNL